MINLKEIDCWEEAGKNQSYLTWGVICHGSPFTEFLTFLEKFGELYWKCKMLKTFLKSVEERLAIPGSKILCYETTKPKSLGF